MRKLIIFLCSWCFALTVICVVLATEIDTLKRHEKNHVESIITLQELVLKYLEIYKNQLSKDKMILKIPNDGWTINAPKNQYLTEPNCNKDCLESLDIDGSHFERNNTVR